MQRKDTLDRPLVVRSLAEKNAYDLVFVVVQSSQVERVLPALAANASQRFVFVGNQPDVGAVERELAEASTALKECAFGVPFRVPLLRFGRLSLRSILRMFFGGARIVARHGGLYSLSA